MHKPLIRQPILLATFATAGLLLQGCTDKPGSEGWCNTMSAKSKSEWTGEEAKT